MTFYGSSNAICANKWCVARRCDKHLHVGKMALSSAVSHCSPNGNLAHSPFADAGIVVITSTLV